MSLGCCKLVVLRCLLEIPVNTLTVLKTKPVTTLPARMPLGCCKLVVLRCLLEIPVNTVAIFKTNGILICTIGIRLMINLIVGGKSKIFRRQLQVGFGATPVFEANAVTALATRILLVGGTLKIPCGFNQILFDTAAPCKTAPVMILGGSMLLIGSEFEILRC
jgi:hypothetical protein